MFRRTLVPLAVLLMTGAAVSAAAAAEPLDVLIRNGTVYDGTGAPARNVDVGVRGGRIVLVGPAGKATAKRVIDAAGLVVSPGFIDPHSHAHQGLEYTTGPFLTEQVLTQGVTTLLAGPDGAMTVSELRALDAQARTRGLGANWACYVGHNGVRDEVMGKAQRAPTAEELERMKALVREGMRFGCVGLSTGLMYEPGMFSKTDEVIALAKEVEPFDGTYDSHTRDPGWKLVESDQELIDIARAAGIPAKIGHEKAVGLVHKGRIGEVIELVERARAEGLDIVADQYPYDGAATLLLRELIIFPDARGAGKSLAEVQAGLRAARADPARLAEIKAATEQGIGGGFSWVKAVGYGSMRVVDAPDDASLMDRNVELMARDQNRPGFDVVADMILASRSDIRITLGTIDEKDLRDLMVQPWVMISSDGADLGKSRGSHHPRSSGSFTRVLGHYVRDEKVLTLAEAIRKMTSLPADHMRLYDRGRLEVGKAADIAVFDPRTVTDRSTYVNPFLLSEGVKFVLVNGKVALSDGKVTGEAAGAFVPRQKR